MKLFLSLFLLFFLHVGLLSQITLQKSDFPKAGDVVEIFESISLTVDYASSGANSVWNFSDLPVGEQKNEEMFAISSGGVFMGMLFGSFAPSQYRATYFQEFNGLPIEQLSNFLPINIGGANQVIKVENEKITTVGYSLEVEGQQVGFKSDVIEMTYQLPLNYGDYYTSSGRTVFDFSPFYDGKLILKRERESEVDGFGKLTTPYRDYENVIRVHHKIKEQDSLRIVVEVVGFPIDQWVPINRTLHEYEWWDKNKKRPVLKIETEAVLGNEVVRRITYIKDDLSDLTMIDQDLKVELFPNPATESIQIKSPIKIDDIYILDATGKIMDKNMVSSSSAVLNIQHLPFGKYVIYAKCGNEYFIRSFIKK